jgi:flavin-dependent dehydrogenase
MAKPVGMMLTKHPLLKNGRKRTLESAAKAKDNQSNLKLKDGARVAVIGGGPAGSFFSYFLLDMANRIGLDIHVDIYEPRDFSCPAPKGCNMCGGIVSETLVQYLAAEGINLPPTVIQRGIESYTMHMDVGSANIETPRHEKRIGAVHRGAGPRKIQETKWESFDGHLQSLAAGKGAQLIPERVREITRMVDGRLQVRIKGSSPIAYDLVSAAIGVNSAAFRLFEDLDLNYRSPQTTKTAIREYYLGSDTIQEHLGNSMHVFLLEIPRLEFAAIIPKGDYVTVCLLGEDIDAELVRDFLSAPEVKGCFPPDWNLDQPACHCGPRINVHGAVEPFGNRIVFLGDCGVTRLYKDGIGAAYRLAKTAAVTAVFEGISADDFRRHYWPACRHIEVDNTIGRLIFIIVRLIQKQRFARRAVLHMVTDEQRRESGQRRMSTVLWDTFTGSAPYREVFISTLHPAFLTRFLWDSAVALWGSWFEVGRRWMVAARQQTR